MKQSKKPLSSRQTAHSSRPLHRADPVLAEEDSPAAVGGKKDTMDKSSSAVQVYDKIAREYARIFDHDDSDTPYVEKLLSLLQPGSEILDLGCGTGRITQLLAQKDNHVIGVDLSKEMIRIAREHFPGMQFLCEDIRTVHFEKSTFDAVSFSYALFHLEPQDGLRVLCHVREILKERGLLLLIVQEGTGEVFVDEPLSPGEKLYLKLYTQDEITNILDSLGFAVVSIERKIPHLQGELPHTKLVVIARKRKESKGERRSGDARATSL